MRRETDGSSFLGEFQVIATIKSLLLLVVDYYWLLVIGYWLLVVDRASGGFRSSGESPVRRHAGDAPSAPRRPTSAPPPPLLVPLAPSGGSSGIGGSALARHGR
eukprot:6512929-Pyramimonas_sp.AAC.1